MYSVEVLKNAFLNRLNNCIDFSNITLNLAIDLINEGYSYKEVANMSEDEIVSKMDEIEYNEHMNEIGDDETLFYNGYIEKNPEEIDTVKVWQNVNTDLSSLILFFRNEDIEGDKYVFYKDENGCLYMNRKSINLDEVFKACN